MADLIQCNNVTFSYMGASEDQSKTSGTVGSEAAALRGVSFSVPAGQFVAIVGANGSGKSTLVRLLDALLVPTEGTITVDGMSTAQPENWYAIRSCVGIVFQNPDNQLVASLVENDVAFGPENLGVKNPELRQRVTEALRIVGCEGFEKRTIASLSGGEKQRIALAGALAMKPRILVLDEATAMLDPHGAAAILRVCQQLHQQGTTIIMVTHHIEEAACAQRVLVMDEGRIVMDGAPEEVLTHNAVTHTYHLAVPFATELCMQLQAEGLAIPLCITADACKEELWRLYSAK